MRTELIDSSITSLVNTFGVRPPVAEKPLRKLFEAKDYVEMVRVIKTDVCRDARIRLGLVNSGDDKKQPRES